MEKIAINLLPQEFRKEEIKRAKFYKIQTVGVAIVLFMTFLASSTVALRILQGQEILRIKYTLAQTEQKISDLKTSQASLLLLKNRLTTINKYAGTSSKQVEMYNLIGKLMPASISVSSISVNKSGEALVLAQAPDGNSIDEMILRFTSPESNFDKISQVSVESLSRGRDGIYRLSFKIKPKL